MLKRFLLLSVTILWMQSISIAADFPLQKKFPLATPISTEELLQEFSDAVVIDVRTAMEFDVAHVTGATLIPLSDKAFMAKVEAKCGKNQSGPLVFYCNGRLCSKSYKAAERATKAGFKNARVYDSGIMAWFKTHPEKTVFLEQTPASPDKIISSDKFKEHQVSFEKFNAMSGESNTVVIDIRDNFQRSVKADLPQNAILVVKGTRIQNIPSDQFAAFVKANGFKNKQLLIADAVGIQIRWAQYFLEEQGYNDYHFLKGGVKTAVEDGHLKM